MKQDSPVRMTLLDPLILPLVPSAVRDWIVAIWSLDAELAHAVSVTTEPMLRRIRLRWWADALVSGAPDVPPLVYALRGNNDQQNWIDLIDAWDDFVVADPLGIDDLMTFARRRGRILFKRTAAALGTIGPGDWQDAGTAWALTDVGLHLQDATLAMACYTAVRALPHTKAQPAAFAALDAVARCVAASNGHRHPRREQAAIFGAGLRAGLRF